MHRSRVVSLAFALLFATGAAHADGRLGVFDAWIRSAPPGTTMLAGYATLKNTGDAPVTVLTAQSDAFRMRRSSPTTSRRCAKSTASSFRQAGRCAWNPAAGT